MAVSKCIRHPPSDPLVLLRQCYLANCEEDHCAAALLSNFEYWNNVRISQIEQERARKRANQDYRENLTFWIYKAGNDLTSDLLGLYGVSKIYKSLEILTRLGFVEDRPNDGPGLNRTHQFLFQQAAVQKAVDSLISMNGNVKNNVSDSLISTSLNNEAEITDTETTEENFSNPPVEAFSFEDLNLDDPIETFAVNAYRRTGRGRLKLTRRSDTSMVDRLQAAEKSHGRVEFRTHLLYFLETDESWLRDNKWPLNRFLQKPDSWLKPEPPRERQEDAGRATGAAPVSLVVGNGSGEPRPARIDYPNRWNELVPAMPVQWDPVRSNTAALMMAELDDLFVEKFDAICQRAQKIHTARPGEQKFLTFNWIIKKRRRQGSMELVQGTSGI